MKHHPLVLAALASAAVAMSSLSLAAGLPMQHIKNAQKKPIKSMGVEGTNAFLEDLMSSDDKQAPLTCGLFRMDKGKALTYSYGYDETKIILDGEMTVSDGRSTVKATKGDMLFFPKGSTITFSSASSGLGFICGQRPRDGA